MRASRFAVLCCLPALLWISGCGEAAAPKDREPVFKVHGKVTYKGKPVVGADIVFKAESADRSAFGRTDDSGEYTLSTFGNNDGAVAGMHTVAVAKVAAAAPTTPEAPVESNDYVPPGFEKVKAPPKKAEAALPAKYAKVETSGLLVIVNGDGSDNTIDIELKD